MMDENLTAETTEDVRPEPGTETQESTTAAAPETPEKPAGPGPIPYERFREVNELLGKYKALGDPETIAERDARLSAIERQEAEENRRRLEAQAREDGLTTQERQALGVLERLLPKLSPETAAKVVDRMQPGTAARLSRLQQSDDYQVAAHDSAAFHEMRDALDKYENLRTDDESVARYKTLVETEILNDPQLARDYWNPASRPTVMTEAVDRMVKLLNGTLQSHGARLIQRHQERKRTTLSRPAPSGTSPAKPAAFSSKHPEGTLAYERDRKAFRNRELYAALDSVTEDSA